MLSRKIISVFLVLLICAQTFGAISFTAFAEGGSDYIEIGTAEELAAVSNNLGGKYRLKNDIDLRGQNWTPIGSGEGYATGSFTGEFDGNGFTVKGLSINIDNSVSTAVDDAGAVCDGGSENNS